MKPGRDLDALIAEKVMGMRPPFELNHNIYTPYECIVDLFSTNIAAAWKVVDKLESTGYGFLELRRRCPGTDAKFAHSAFSRRWVPGESAPHAICVAALKAVGHE